MSPFREDCQGVNLRLELLVVGGSLRRKSKACSGACAIVHGRPVGIRWCPPQKEGGFRERGMAQVCMSEGGGLIVVGCFARMQWELRQRGL